MPKHSYEPTQPIHIMHEDDPVITKRFPTPFTRKNIKKLAVVAATFTFVCLLILIWQVIHAQEQITNIQQQQEQERTDRRADVNDGICSVIGLVPPGNDRVDAVRTKFNCGSFIPEPGGPTRLPSSTPTASETVPRVSFTPSVGSTPSVSSASVPTPSAIPSASTPRPSPTPTAGITVSTTKTLPISIPPLVISLTPPSLTVVCQILDVLCQGP